MAVSTPVYHVCFMLHASCHADRVSIHTNNVLGCLSLATSLNDAQDLVLQLQPKPEMQHGEDSRDRVGRFAQPQCSQMGNPSQSTSFPQLAGQSDIEQLHSPPTLWAASGDGGGIPARQLLQKVKWATVGPRYDWTERIYDPATPYRPLPKFAAAAALRISGLVAAHPSGAGAASRTSDGLHGQPDDPGRLPATGSAAPGSCTDQPADRAQSTPHSATAGSLEQEQSTSCHEQSVLPVLQSSPKANNEAASFTLQHCSPSRQIGPFVPDAALVCFYRAGDTLCGHQDDAEADVSQVRSLNIWSLAASVSLLSSGPVHC